MSADRTRPVVAIVGRPNVGKSTLFNRLAGRRLAIVEDRPGITRDRNYAPAEHEGRGYLLVDTGGFEPDAKDRLIQQVRDQARLAVEEAQAVILVVDGTAGPTPVDIEIAEMLRRGGKPLILAVNKIDSSRREEEEFLSEFYRLGLPEVFPVSAEHARGINDMLDRLLELIPGAPRIEPEREAAEEAGGAPYDSEEEAPETPPEAPSEEEDRSKPIRVAILGRPNVGKSTLLNSLLGEERFVTSPVAGTTRDPVDAEVERRGRTFVLTDTAGIRRKRSIALKVEAYSVLRALKAAETSDVVVVLLDATEFVVEQDAKIAGLAEEQGKPLLVVVNKWDLIAGDKKKQDEFLADLRWKLPWISYAPALFLSALEGRGTERVLEVAERLYDQSGARVPTAMLNRVLAEISEHHALPVVDGKRARIYYVAQTHRRPPVFSLVTTRPDLVPPDYRRYVANKLREVFGLEVPIRLAIRRKAGARGGPRRRR